jgi:hypothetical protein
MIHEFASLMIARIRRREHGAAEDPGVELSRSGLIADRQKVSDDKPFGWNGSVGKVQALLLRDAVPGPQPSELGRETASGARKEARKLRWM